MKNFTKQITNKTLFKPTRWLLMALMLLVGTSSAWGKTIYCKNEQGWWKKDGAAVGVYYWGGSEDPDWPGIRMTPVAGETNIWSCDVPDGYSNIIFTRVNGSGNIADWGAKTGDLTIPTDGGNLYTITSTSEVWGNPGVSGTWSCYENVTEQAANIYDFEDVGIGESKTLTFKFDYIASCSGINPSFLDAGEGFNLVSSSTDNNVVTFEVKFEPTSEGEKTATLQIAWSNGGLLKKTIYATGVKTCDEPVIVTNSATYNQSTGLVDLTYSISETGGTTTHYGIQYRAEDSAFPTQGLTDADFIKIGQTDNTVTNATYIYQTVLTPGTYYFRTYANNGCPAFDYSVGMVYGQEKQVVVPKKAQPTLTLTGVTTTYCTVPNEPITLSTTGGSGGGAVSYQIVNDGTTATASITTNQLSITSAGTLKLKAIKAEDTNFNQAESEVVTVTIYEDIEAGSISASETEVCEGAEVTLTLTGNTEGTKITWTASDCESPAESVANDATQFITNVSKQTCYMVEVSREDAGCPVKIAQTNSVQINTVAPSAITLSDSQEACIGTEISLDEKINSYNGEVTWYTDQDGTQVVDNTDITVSANVTYYAKAKNGICPATEAVSYAITAKGVTIISQDPATVHPYEVTTFTASGNASWEISTNPSTGADVDSNDPVFSGKTTAYITKADGTTTTFKGEAATGYTISATAEECTTTQTFDVVDDPNNCQQ